MNPCFPCFPCFKSNVQQYTFLADPDYLLINEINTIYVNDDRYNILGKKAHMIKKCRKYYNIWNYHIIKHLTNHQYLLTISSQEKNRWYIMPYNKHLLGILPKNIKNKTEVRRLDYSISLEDNRKKKDFFDIPLVD